MITKKLVLSVMALMMGCHLVWGQKSIVILYENDAHCGIDGYTKIAGLRDAINHSDTAYAAAVCCGDFLQGNTTGAISKGQYIADILRLMDYNALTLGNHEFDYGVPRMKQLLEQLCLMAELKSVKNLYIQVLIIQKNWLKMSTSKFTTTNQNFKNICKKMAT